MDRIELGYRTAKGGFANEKDICVKFNNWKVDKEAQTWFKILGGLFNKLCVSKTIYEASKTIFGVPNSILKDYLHSYLNGLHIEKIDFVKAESR
ncbi:MAG: hypothetical protein IEMM0008_0961 [bacterium]|nr:MAG: hypothetical protein IEMM0008_0961 [bacterium]